MLLHRCCIEVETIRIDTLQRNAYIRKSCSGEGGAGIIAGTAAEGALPTNSQAKGLIRMEDRF
jgi:hypothetical protein